jgi:hypothetical protein
MNANVSGYFDKRSGSYVSASVIYLFVYDFVDSNFNHMTVSIFNGQCDGGADVCKRYALNKCLIINCGS